MTKNIFENWSDNRPSKLRTKLKRWSHNPIGGFVRILEIIYFGSPLVAFLRNNGDIDLVSHLSETVDLEKSNEKIITLRNVKVNIENNFVLLDSGHIFNRRLNSHEILSGQYWNQIRNLRCSKQELKKLNGDYYSIALQRYYYHFIVEELPEIINLINEKHVIKFVSLEPQPKFVTDYLDLLGIRVEFVKEALVQFECLLQPTYSSGISKSNIDSLSTLIDTLETGSNVQDKILLLRNGMSREDQELEVNLRSTLIPLGFTVLEPEMMTAKEQINLFAKANLIVGVHGGSLSNIVFSNSSSSVFEIFSHPYRTHFFRDIAKVKGISYESCESKDIFETLPKWLKNKL